MKKLIFLFALAIIIFFGSCQKSKLTCEITSPKDGAEVSIHKDLVIEINATDTKNSVTAITVYLNNLPYPCTTTAPYTCTIPSILLELGKFTVRAVAINNIGDQEEASISITIIDDGDDEDEDESPDFVDFANGKIPPSWKTSTWVIENTIGYNDNYSLKSSDLGISSVLTHKTMNAYGYVEFFTRGDNFELHIDGVKATPLLSVNSDVPNWKRWVYSFNKGRHSFRWETTGYTVFLDNIKFALAELPKVTTNSTATNVTTTSAVSGGRVTEDGNSSVTARGVCWSSSQNPTISNSKTVDGSGIGNFTSNITGLAQGNTYYVRAYATNDVGTVYGEQITFQTPSTGLPTVTTGNVTNITSSTADCGGNVTNDGNSTVTARGVCWSTSQNPTINNSKTVDGSGTGNFSSRMTGLILGTTYYVRAYATNSTGTAYGEQKSFTPKLAIGDNYQGGKIAYIDHTGIHGFIAAPNDNSTGVVWGYYGVTTGATGTGIGTGKSNTDIIIQVTEPIAGGGNYSAKVCDNLNLDGYNDWYLPSRDELNELYKNENKIGNFNATSMYWSSSESNNNNAWVHYFQNGNQGPVAKLLDCRIRCIRSF